MYGLSYVVNDSGLEPMFVRTSPAAIDNRLVVVSDRRYFLDNVLVRVTTICYCIRHSYKHLALLSTVDSMPAQTTRKARGTRGSTIVSVVSTSMHPPPLNTLGGYERCSFPCWKTWRQLTNAQSPTRTKAKARNPTACVPDFHNHPKLRA